MKILVISSTPWASDNSFGNSFSNIFDSIDGLEFANIYCKSGLPDNKLKMVCYQISEKKLVKSIINPKIKTGKKVTSEQSDSKNTNAAGREAMRKIRFTWMLWIRDLIWKLGRWKTNELKQFIDEFNPDIIFQPIYFSTYLNEMALYVKKLTGKKMIGYISDDCYTLRQFSLSPLYWIDRLIKRSYVKKAINNCELLYVISDIQKQEYEKIFNVKCKVLTKCADFSQSPELKTEIKEPLKIVYTGNLGAGRWQSVSYIKDALVNINREINRAQLYIYSATPLTEKQKNALADGKNSFFMGAVPSSEIEAIQKDADILVHAEGMNLKSRLQVHQSFSTKIVDYLKNARAIFAVGPADAASIDYFIKNDSAVTAVNENEVENKLREYTDNPEKINEYAEKAYLCGKKFHSADLIKKMVCEDLQRSI